jgi:hypothetical protein
MTPATATAASNSNLPKRPCESPSSPQQPRAQPLKSPAGWVLVDADKGHLVVTETTIEKVGQHQDSLREMVSKIATEGEEYRKRAVEAQRAAADEETARQEERARRREAAKKINFDNG